MKKKRSQPYGKWFEGYWLGLSVEPDDDGKMIIQKNYNTVLCIKSEGGTIQLNAFVLENGAYTGKYWSKSMSIHENSLWFSYEKEISGTITAKGVGVYRFNQKDIENNNVNDLNGVFIDNIKKMDLKYFAMRISGNEYSILTHTHPDFLKINNGISIDDGRKLLLEKNSHLIKRASLDNTKP